MDHNHEIAEDVYGYNLIIEAYAYKPSMIGADDVPRYATVSLDLKDLNVKVICVYLPGKETLL